MNATEPVTGAEWLARTLAINGTTHVFFIDAVLRRTLIELGALGVTRVLAHAENGLNVAAALGLGLLWSWRSSIGWRATLDRCAPVGVQLDWLRELGFDQVDCPYKAGRFAVLTGRKPN